MDSGCLQPCGTVKPVWLCLDACFPQALSWAGAWVMNGYQQLNGGNTTTSPTTTDKGEGLSLPRWAPIKEATAAGKPLSPLGPTRAPEKPEHSHSFVSVGQAGRQGWPGLASNGDQMGHGPWGQGWARYRGGFNRKGKSEGPGGRKPSLTPTQQGVSLLQGHPSHCSSHSHPGSSLSRSELSG